LPLPHYVSSKEVVLNFTWITSLCSVITEDEAVVLHVALSPEGLGSASYYLPVLVDEHRDQGGATEDSEQR
jgi:hypothetical protein